MKNNNYNKIKPKLTYQQKIQHLIDKGITFNTYTQSDAAQYLRLNNNFFKLSSYRKNYPKDITQTRYLNLDFGHLVDLAVIDMYLRSIILKMALNIEHYAKMELLNRITDDDTEDGYSVVQDYISSLPKDIKDSVKHELARNSNSPYCKNLYTKYNNQFPIWVFVEIISFGTFSYFYGFCQQRFYNRDLQKYNNHILFLKNKKTSPLKDTKANILHNKIILDKRMKSKFFLLLSVKHLRNASAHNNCILNNIQEQNSAIRPRADTRMITELSSLGISNLTINKRLNNPKILELFSCLYAHKIFVSSKGVSLNTAKELHLFKNRLFQKYDYTDNLKIKATFAMIAKAIDKWFPVV